MIDGSQHLKAADSHYVTRLLIELQQKVSRRGGRTKGDVP